MNENQQLKHFTLPEIGNLNVHGRTTECLFPLTLFWTGSGVEFNAKGSELWLEVEINFETYEPWMSVLINSVCVSRQMLTRGRYWICVFRGMSADVVKNVRILKDVQPISDDPSCIFQIHSVKFDGEFLEVEERAFKLEFIGDSITSGEGAIGAKTEEDWIPMWFSAINNYCTITAEAINADYRIISQSGWGVLTSWDNNPNRNIPDYYEKVCGPLTGEKNKSIGAFKDYEFGSWQPDVVVVNLGTNDGGAFYSPEWQDPDTGEIHKQRLNEDQSFNEEDLKSFEEAVESFLIKLRNYNRKAHIVWAYGMLGIPMLPTIYRAVDSYIKKTGDQSVSIFQLPNMTNETIGARNHPGQLAHEKTARELTGYIKQILNVV